MRSTRLFVYELLNIINYYFIFMIPPVLSGFSTNKFDTFEVDPFDYAGPTRCRLDTSKPNSLSVDTWRSIPLKSTLTD